MKNLQSYDLRASLISTKVSASHRKPTQVHARPGQRESQVDPSFQLASTCKSIWPRLTICLVSIFIALFNNGAMNIVLKYIKKKKRKENEQKTKQRHKEFVKRAFQALAVIQSTSLGQNEQSILTMNSLSISLLPVIVLV